MHVLKGCYEEYLLFLWLAVNASVVFNFLLETFAKLLNIG